ncbi:hypothetical protein [uncultured Alteromonas sp.]|jgi:hypothetical protein|uniref:hypothetical protein n=1 Tax=uncultured Alteromonas sp. TaxID=179113 RepID=UPI0025E8160A|nr:hypothetical protein [uncultured Alteromonas sp.]
MTYTTTKHEGVVIEEYVTGRILRITHNGQSFKFYAHSEGELEVAIYIGHGRLTNAIKRAIKAWAKSAGICIACWGDAHELNKTCKIRKN